MLGLNAHLSESEDDKKTTEQERERDGVDNNTLTPTSKIQYENFFLQFPFSWYTKLTPVNSSYLS